MSIYANSLVDAEEERPTFAAWSTAAAGGAAVAFWLALPWMSGGGYAYAGSLRATTAEGAATLALLFLGFRLWLMADEKATSILRHPGVWLIVAFTAWAALSRFWTADELATSQTLRQPLAFALVFLFLLAASAEDKWRLAIFGAAVVSGVILGIGAILFRAAGLHATGRFQYPYDHPAALAGALVWPTVALSLLVVFLLVRRRWLSAAAAAMAFAPCAAALWGTGTRSSLLGAGAGIVAGITFGRDPLAICLPMWQNFCGAW
ncbi:MAG: hypothetical protein N3A66_04130 [Planctomycetota bacterium]|nr:hypothetical protein [Planctomycetota bacterium]